MGSWHLIYWLSHSEPHDVNNVEGKAGNDPKEDGKGKQRDIEIIVCFEVKLTVSTRSWLLEVAAQAW